VGKHGTGYTRAEKDLYPTPAWVIVEALAEVVGLAGAHVWEFAAGDGRMCRALESVGATVYASDIVDPHGCCDEILDFTSEQQPRLAQFHAGITNPPYGQGGKLAEAFIAAGLRRTSGQQLLALLLPCDFDSAKTRARFFGDCPRFMGKIVLRRRIKWFEHPEKKKKQPKENHAWFLWREPRVLQRPSLWYAPRLEHPRTGQSHRTFETSPSPSRMVAPVAFQEPPT
jgi:hypothetical protein